MNGDVHGNLLNIMTQIVFLMGAVEGEEDGCPVPFGIKLHFSESITQYSGLGEFIMESGNAVCSFISGINTSVVKIDFPDFAAKKRFKEQAETFIKFLKL
jgi:hypothetical protein